MAAPVAVLSILVTANTKQAAGQLTQLDARLKSTEGTAQKLGHALATVGKVGAIGAAAGFAYAVKKAADFEQQMSSLESVTSANERQMKRLERSAIRAGNATKFSALEAAKAQTELAKGGLTVTQILRGGLSSALGLASAGELDLADAAATTANAIKLFGLRGKDSVKVADALAVAANRTTADVQDFAMALKQGGGVAKLAGLNLNETVVILEALAETGVKNADAGTSLKTFFLNLTRNSKPAKKAMADLGVEIFNQQGQLKSLPAISKNLRQAFGDLTKEEFLNKAGVIAGSDAVRTLYALYSQGPEKLRRLQKATAESGFAAEVARKKQDNLRGDLEKLQGTFETLAIVMGGKALPGVRKFVQGVDDSLKQVGKILANKKLTGEEKVQRITDVLLEKLPTGEEIAKWADRLGELIGKAAPVLIKAVAKLAGAMARAFWVAFRESPWWVKLFTAAFIVTRIFGGGNRGSAAFRTQGQTAGQAFSGGFRGAIFGSLGAGLVEVLGNQLSKRGGILGKLGGVVGRPGASPANALWVKVVPGFGGVGGGKGLPGGVLGKVGGPAALRAAFVGLGTATLAGVGIAVAAHILKNKTGIGLPTDRDRPTTSGEARARGGKRGEQEFFERRGRTPSGHAPQGPVGDPRALRGIEAGPGTKNEVAIANTVKLGEAAKQARKNIAELRKMGGSDMDALRTKVNRNLGDIAQRFAKDTTAARVYTRRNFGALGTAIQESVARGRTSVAKAMETIKALVKTNAKGSKDAASENFFQIRKAIARNMDGSVRIADKGNKLLRQLFATELANFGFTKQEIKFRLAGKEFSGKTIGGSDQGVFVNKARGGLIDVGKPSGDSVHAMLEKGEYVLNRKAVKAAGGQKALDAFNFGAVPRMQSGGIVRLGRQLQRQGYLVGENPAFGGVHPVHVANSWHYKGQALDVNWPDAAAEPRMLDRLYGRLKHMRGVVELLWRVAGHFDHLHVALSGGAGGGLAGLVAKIKRLQVKGGEGSALHDLLQTGLDRVRSGAQAKLDALTGSMEGFETGLGGNSAENLRLGQRMAARFGWTGGQWRALRELWTRESGWSNMARNPSSGAFGIPQALPPDKMGPAAVAGDAGAQILWGLRYILGRYGSPEAALAFHNAHNWYKAGGPVEMLFGGGARGDVVAGAAAKKKKGRTKVHFPRFPGIEDYFSAPLGQKPEFLKFYKPPPPGSGIWKQILGTLKKVRTGKGGKKALNRLMKRINNINVPGMKKIKALRELASQQEGWANNASTLTEAFADRRAFEGLPVDVLRGLAQAHLNSMPKAQQALIEWDKRTIQNVGEDALREILGIPVWRTFTGKGGAKTEVEWLSAELATLVSTRNKEIRAQGNIADQQKVVKRLIGRSEKRLKTINNVLKWRGHMRDALDKIRDLSGKTAPKKARAIVDRLKNKLPRSMWNPLKKAADTDRPKKNVEAALVDQIKGINKAYGDKEHPNRPEAVQRALVRIIGDDSHGLKGKRAALKQAGIDVTSWLEEVQGTPAPAVAKKIYSLGQLPPFSAGLLGGEIFRVQGDLFGLGAKIPLPAETPSEGAGETAELLKQLLRESNLRGEINATALRTLAFAKTDPFLRAAGLPFAGTFQSGGVVPGLPSQASMAIVHGGETIVPKGDAHVQVILHPGMEWLDKYIEVKVDGVTRKQSNPARAPLPGRGGGLLR